MRRARVLAQAKINLLLRVGHREANGYHQIGTIFQRIDLADEIEVRTGGPTRSIEVTGPMVPADGLGAPESNLAYRAAVAYAEQTGWPGGFAIELTKKIPVGGGLGGGSADAGAVLRALNALAPAPLRGTALRKIGASLGSDVPFLSSEFVTAVGGGRGERLHKFAPPLPRTAVIVVPGFAVSTADAYRWLDESRPVVLREDSPGLVPEVPSATWFDLEQPQLSGNDFEPVVEARHPALASYREKLTSLGASIARLSGSGSCVFGIFEGEAPPAESIATDAQIIVTRTSARVVQVVVEE